ncbi:HDIG domain-containing protein [Bacteroidia bacterium]|nr:HDIG domain-containing protein [Bacteroidia bacterium]
MNNKYFNNNIFWFVVVTLVLIAFFPRGQKFQYTFVEGKPWKYSLLTAPFDFPIYKLPEQLKAEQDSVSALILPYFQLNKAEYAQQQELFNAAYKQYPKTHWNAEYKRYLDKILKEIYTSGIVSNQDYQWLRTRHYESFNVLQNEKQSVIHPTNDVYTIKSAYSALLDNCPENLNINVLRSVDLNNFLRENLTYDALFSEKIKADDLQKIPTSNGVVQAGEKIVDKGEIITSKSYAILRSLQQIEQANDSGTQAQISQMAGIVILVAGLMACLLLYLAYFRKKIYANRKDVIFLLSMVSIFAFLTEISIYTGLFSVYIIPYAIIPIVVRTFFESRTAQITNLITILICSLMLPVATEFIIVQLLVCFVALYVLKDLSKRSELINCAIYIFAGYVLSYLGYRLSDGETFADLHWDILLFFGINFLLVLFTYSFIYIIEKIFGYISNVTLVELSDINLPALTELSEKCPGTFQHSLQVSMLGTAAAAKIGANGQLVRTGALYHDLGKLKNPEYFTENMPAGKNPHDDLTLEQSAQIITNHVPEGVKQARHFQLPPAIIKFILTHHGAGKAKYFYNSFKNQFPDEPINEAVFSYEGTNPDTKETAILMMADSVEAASRSLPDYTEASIHQLVDKIIDGQIADGLLNHAPLTFRNITDIKNVFVEKLLSVHHARVSYPELEKK